MRRSPTAIALAASLLHAPGGPPLAQGGGTEFVPVIMDTIRRVVAPSSADPPGPPGPPVPPPPPGTPGAAHPDPLGASIAEKLVPDPLLPLPFRGCAVPKTAPVLPPQTCEPPPPPEPSMMQQCLAQGQPPQMCGPQATMAAMDRLRTEAQKNVLFFEGMLSESKHETPRGGASGLQCLRDRVKLEEDGFQNNLNGLTAALDQIKAKDEEFRGRLQAMTDSLRDLDACLTGKDALVERGSGGESEEMDLDKCRAVSTSGNRELAARGLDMLGPERCLDVISANMDGGGDVRGIWKEKGLMGMWEGLGGINVQAGQYTRNEEAVKADIEKRIGEITDDIERYGVDAWLANGAESTGSASVIQSLEAARGREVQKFQQARASLLQELGALGIQEDGLPKMGRNFGTDIGHFKRRFVRDVQRGYVDDCVNREDHGVGTFRDVLAGLYQPNARGRGTVASFRGEIDSILAREGFIEDKMGAFQELLGRYGRDTIVVDVMKDGRRVSADVHTMLSDMIDVCRTKYELGDGLADGPAAPEEPVNRTGTAEVDEDGAVKVDDGSSAGGGEGDGVDASTPKGRAARIESILDEYAELGSRLQSDVVSAIRREVVECDGRKEAKAGSCGEATFNTEDPSFCLAQAGSCATDITSCHSIVESRVEEMNHEANLLASQYNGMVKELIDNQNTLLNDMKARLGTYAQRINAILPGANFELPEDMRIETPELGVTKYGVALLGGGDLEGLFTALPAKIEALEGALREQNGNAVGALNAYIGEQAQNMNDSKGAWQDVEEGCGGAIRDQQQQMMTQQQERMKQRQEQMEKFGAFCRRFGQMQRNPAAACDGVADELHETSTEISAFLSPDAIEFIDDYKVLCSSSQNMSDEGSEIGGTNFFNKCLQDPKATSEEIEGSFANFSSGDGSSSMDLSARSLALTVDGILDNKESGGDHVKRKIDAEFGIDVGKVRDALRSYRNACNTSRTFPDDSDNPDYEDYDLFCTKLDNLNRDIESITIDNLDEPLKSYLRELNATAPLRRPSAMELPIPTEDEEDLERNLRERLSAVMERKNAEPNICNRVVTSAVMDAAKGCRTKENGKNACFYEKMQELSDEGAEEFRPLARASLELEKQSMFAGLGEETHLGNVPCHNIRSGDDDFHYEAEPDTGEDVLDDYFDGGQGR